MSVSVRPLGGIRVIVAALFGTVLICGAVLLDARLDATVEQRVSEGTAVTGRVVQVERFRISRSSSVTRMTVAYAVDGVAYQERFSSELDEGRHHAGEELTVYVDRNDPSKAATADRYATEDLLLQLPDLLGVAGGLAIVAALVWIKTGGRPPGTR
ncbi:DUF3592 domain-containing protein [Micromonospora rubida]|uniref:DUF3592 domain-containing protein n=1 Tax=Micromonospora rubida TaxID=2697657 RepID=UPI001376F57D|nr:DUF3592 domain-containing protein [Micromonospora rubida]NBE81621.1 DUF3592 domain-containing protein [Micromonospora rubida]